jgi:hypothetical protein
MLQKLFVLCLSMVSLYGVEYHFNTQNLNDVHAKISSDEAIAEVKMAPKLSYAALNQEMQGDETKDDVHKILQRDLDRIKRLQGRLANDTNTSNIKKRLQDAFFSSNANKKQELSFAYAIEYPTSGSYDDAYAMLLQKISLYIVQTYGVANVSYQQIMKDLSLADEQINTHTIGTVEVVPNKSIENSFHHKKNASIKNGVITFVFYPFTKIKRIDSQDESVDFAKVDSEQKILFIDFEKTRDLKEIEEYLLEDDHALFEEYLATYLGTQQIDIQRSLSDISKKRGAYSKVAMELFSKYPTCQNLGCLEQEVSKKLSAVSEVGGMREYLYHIKLSNDVEYSDAIYMAYRKLKRNLKHDTVMNSVDDTQQLRGDEFQRKASKTKLKPVYKYIDVKPYHRANSLGLQIRVKVSFEVADLCAQYYLGEVDDVELGIRFAKLLNDKGEIIEVSTTEISNATFKNCQINEKSSFLLVPTPHPFTGYFVT